MQRKNRFLMAVVPLPVQVAPSGAGVLQSPAVGVPLAVPWQPGIDVGLGGTAQAMLHPLGAARCAFSQHSGFLIGSSMIGPSAEAALDASINAPKSNGTIESMKRFIRPHG